MKSSLRNRAVIISNRDLQSGLKAVTVAEKISNSSRIDIRSVQAIANSSSAPIRDSSLLFDRCPRCAVMMRGNSVKLRPINFFFSASFSVSAPAKTARIFVIRFSFCVSVSPYISMTVCWNQLLCLILPSELKNKGERNEMNHCRVLYTHSTLPLNSIDQPFHRA